MKKCINCGRTNLKTLCQCRYCGCYQFQIIKQWYQETWFVVVAIILGISIIGVICKALTPSTFMSSLHSSEYYFYRSYHDNNPFLEEINGYTTNDLVYLYADSEELKNKLKRYTSWWKGDNYDAINPYYNKLYEDISARKRDIDKRNPIYIIGTVQYIEKDFWGEYSIHFTNNIWCRNIDVSELDQINKDDIITIRGEFIGKSISYDCLEAIDCHIVSKVIEYRQYNK
jgi:hypothetical protein